MSLHPLQRYIVEAEALRAQLKAECGDDEQAIIDTLEGATDLDKVVEILDASIFRDESLIAGVDAEMAKLKTLKLRKDRLEKRIETKYALAKKAFEVAGWNQARQTPLGTVSLTNKAPCLGPLEEAKIPVRYWKDQDPKLDRVGLLNDVKDGQKVPGASLAPPTKVLSIRRA